MALGGGTGNNNETLPIIVDASEEVANDLKPSSGDGVDNIDSAEKAVEVVRKNSKAMDVVVKHIQNNPKIIEAILTKLIQDRTTMKKTVTFGQMLTIAGITLPVSGILGGIIGTNLGAIGVGLGAVGAGLAVAGPTIGFVLAGIAGLVAIAALAFAAYKYKDKIKSGAEDIGKKVKDLLKDILGKIPLSVTNAQELYLNVANKDAQDRMNQGNPLTDDVAFVEQYLLNQDGLAALRKYITDDPNKGKITLADKTELTLEDLNKLETQSKGQFGIDKAEFRKELSRFAPIMHKNNITLRTGIEGMQNAIHAGKNRQAPPPSSPLYPGSVANNELLALFDDDKRKDMNDLLQSIVGKGPELKGGLNKDFRQDFYKVLSGESYKLNLAELSKLDKEGSEGLTELADELNKLDNNQIKDLKEEVEKLKKEQAKGPHKKLDDTGASKTESPGQEQGI